MRLGILHKCFHSSVGFGWTILLDWKSLSSFSLGLLGLFINLRIRCVSLLSAHLDKDSSASITKVKPFKAIAAEFTKCVWFGGDIVRLSLPVWLSINLSRGLLVELALWPKDRPNARASKAAVCLLAATTTVPGTVG
jgi:hypothetical protein